MVKHALKTHFEHFGALCIKGLKSFQAYLYYSCDWNTEGLQSPQDYQLQPLKIMGKTESSN